jgi:hypothetical protein
MAHVQTVLGPSETMTVANPRLILTIATPTV